MWPIGLFATVPQNKQANASNYHRHTDSNLVNSSVNCSSAK